MGCLIARQFFSLLSLPDMFSLLSLKFAFFVTFRNIIPFSNLNSPLPCNIFSMNVTLVVRNSCENIKFRTFVSPGAGISRKKRFA